MYVYAGIDETGYGPFFGPMTVGPCVLAIPKLDAEAEPPELWSRLSKAVCRTLSRRKGRVVVNDSKKLKTKAAGIKHLELGCLAFAGMWDRVGDSPGNVGDWLDALGERSHRELHDVPWYTLDGAGPWAELPCAADAGELAIARGMLATTCRRIGVEVADMGCAVVFEDRFNRMVATTHSKAAVSFTFVAGHLQHVWQHHGQHHPTVVVDRQSGRMRYRELLAMNFPGTNVDVLRETAAHSTYRISEASEVVRSGSVSREDSTHADAEEQGYEASGTAPPESRPPTHSSRAMTVHFQTEAEQQHMPVALASMLAKYARELMMDRFNRYFTAHLPHIAPTAGYGSDAKRFWQEVHPECARMKINPTTLRRQA